MKLADLANEQLNRRLMETVELLDKVNIAGGLKANTTDSSEDEKKMEIINGFTEAQQKQYDVAKKNANSAQGFANG